MTIVLNFENIKNVRDLGQTSTKYGTAIKRNHLLRAANPCFASKKDCQQLQNLDIDVVVDFRDKHEKKKTEKPFQKMFQNDALPITAGNLTPTNLIPTLQRSSSEEMRRYMKELYASFPIEFQEQYQSFLRHAEQGKKVLYHCTAGKDRTGFGSALLLSALDVDYEIIMDDFLASNVYFAEVGNQLTQQLEDEGVNKFNKPFDKLLTILAQRTAE